MASRDLEIFLICKLGSYAASIIIDIVPQKQDDILTHETDIADLNSLAT